uniref:Amidophosphoribosyltransferase n=1 Tax=Bionectria ochroleuca TaxID=29856 RepID=A0A8H7TSV4_BIOOC
MCGISAILLGDPKATTAAVDLHESLYYLQHRGQDAAGIAVCQGGRVYQAKSNGLASKVFDEGRRIAELPGFMGISHLRYPTAGTSSASEAQPFYVNSPFGLSMSINGNITNPQEVARFLDQEARRHVNTASDSELVLNVFANALNELGKARANVDDIFTALRDVYKRCIGAYSCVAMVAGFGLLAFRDSNGIRPLCLGSRPSATIEGAKDYFLASESIALTQLGFTDVVNIKPGEAVFIQKGVFLSSSRSRRGIPGLWISLKWVKSTPACPSLYFARPDSELDGISVHRSRENMGRKLAKKIKDTLSKEAFDEIDVVIPVPETSNTSASILAQEMGKPFSNAFVKNRYIFRTFIPGQKARRAGIRRKLSCIKSEFKDRVVLLTDDSIVRGNTSREIVQMAKEAGAKKVLFVSCSPEIRYPHVHGIDLADRDELIAYGKTAEEVATAIGASEVVYQSLDDLKDACREAIQDGYEKIDFETGVFSGQYTTPVPEEYFEHLERLRSNKKRKAAAITESEGGAQTVLVASGGPVNVSSRNHIQDEDVKGPENREDVSIYNFAGKA